MRRWWDWDNRSSRATLPGDPDSEVFDAFVPDPIGEWEPVFGAAVWRKVVEAEAALSALAADPGAESAAWLLSRAEAASSSIIESVRPSARGLARAEAGLSIPGDEPFWDDEEPYGPELETLRHARAADHALAVPADGRAVTVDDICDIHRVLMGSDPIAGQLRERQNWIGLPWSTPLDAAFVPSPPELVPELVDDLAACINRSALVLWVPETRPWSLTCRDAGRC